MKDIRIIAGNRILPDFDASVSLFESQNAAGGQTIARQLFQELSLPVQMHIRPKAALLITKPPFSLPCEDPFNSSDSGSHILLYVMLTIGSGVSRLAETYAAQNAFKASMADAMADSCLSAFEKQLLPVIRQLCREEGFDINTRLEIPNDLPLEMQREVFHALDADRTLNLSIDSNHALSSAKSKSLVFTLTKNHLKNALTHDCSACALQNCPLHKKSGLTLRIKYRPNAGDDYVTTELSCPYGGNLLELLQERHFFLPAYCGGQGVCGKCGVRLLNGSLPVTMDDRSVYSEDELQKGMRLSCRAVVKTPLTVQLENHRETDMQALGISPAHTAPLSVLASYPPEDYGIAIDIGTTTLAFSLLNLHTGICSGSLTMVNSQRAFGADIISRIQASSSGKKDLLQECILTDLRKGILRLIKQKLSGSGRIRHIAIAANTVMMHLFRGYSCEGFLRYPFSAVSLSLETLTWTEAFGESDDLPFLPDVTLLPGITPFVGADITAGLYACRVLAEPDPILFLDLGTNGEMALWKNQKLFVTSTAAGPAFEGGNIKWGMGSVPGAISNVTIENGRPFIKTIGNGQPEGICGTGVIETTAELLRAGILDQTGKLTDSYIKEGYPLARTKDGSRISFTNPDVRELQMAKAAIRAGMETLLFRSGAALEEIGKVFLAGGFGYYLNLKKAAAIGLLPEEFPAKTILAGNASLNGALLYLSTRNQDAFRQIRDAASEIPLAKDEYFLKLYLRCMDFDHA